MEAMIWKWTRFVIGVVMFAALMVVHVVYKELPQFILAAPFFLMGFDAADLAKSILGSKK